MTLSAGTRLGPYEILAPLGVGGMGEVYRARDKKLDRDVAVKVLPESFAKDPDALARFEREAKAVAALSHPNILSIHDFGSDGGRAYAVMELLEGETLRSKIESRAISQKQAVEWALQIARGLSAAHGKGLVHRDLKPDNVFVTKDGHVKILDFGLAKRLEAASEHDQTSVPTGAGHTEPGTVLGTMGYMSPEQLRGLPVDHRSDIFSFGAILYELLSGKRAFKKDTASDTIAAVLKEDPPELTQSGRNISPALDHVVRHCLEKDREDRFQTAKDVMFALSEASGSVTAASVAPGPGRRRVPLIAAAVVLLLIGAGLLLLRRPHVSVRPTTGPKRVAVLPFENVGSAEDDYFADGVSDEIRTKLTTLPGVQVIARGSSTPYKKTTKTPKEIAKELDVEYLLTATVRWQKGAGAERVHVTPELIEVSGSGSPTSKWQQPFDAALTDVFQVQSDIASRVASALGVALGAGQEKQLSEKPTQNLAAYDAFLKGEEVSKSLAVGDAANLRKALGYYEQATALDPRFAHAWAQASIARSLLYNNATPTPELRDGAREAAERAIALAPDKPEGYLALGTFYRVARADFPAALEQYAKGRRLAPDNADLLGAAAGAEEGLGHWDKSVDFYRQAVRLDPRSLGTQRRLTEALLWLRRYPEAREACDRGLVIAPSNLDLIEDNAMIYLGEGNLPAARAVLANVPPDVTPSVLVAFVANYWDLGWALSDEQQNLLLTLTPAAFDDDRSAWAINLAQIYALRKDAANVRSHAEIAEGETAAVLRRTPDNPGRLMIHGLALAYLGRGNEAIHEGERGVSLEPISRSAVSGPYFVHQLARIYMLVGEPEKAIDRLEELLKVPYFVSRAWLKIDPNFDPLRQNPRFQKLVAGGK